ncbi:MAG: hypothetical protein LBQ57_07560 [Spirochaetales bacterium]|jgi:beta-N-acetylhexosaminidase|nr:hypothetical protein [Spirochaetales bacterium]
MHLNKDWVIAVLVLSAALAGCAPPADTGPLSAPAAAASNLSPAYPADTPPPAAGTEKSLARALARAMTIEEKCAQILMIAAGTEPSLPKDFAELIKTVPAGAVLLLGYNIAESPGKIMNLSADFQKTAAAVGKGIPFLIALDHEGGTVYRLGGAATRIPGAARAGAFLEKKDAQPESRNAALFRLYRSSAAQLSLLGFSLNLAPVLEPLSEANKEFLRHRSYAGDAGTVSRAGGIFIDAMRAGGVLAVGKHFPGTGGGDPHEKLTYINLDMPQDILPFRDAARVHALGALMVSHSVAPALDPALPVSVSPPALSWIRRHLDFEGIILTDDVNMKALSAQRSPEEAAVMAVAAGADMIMYLDERGITKVHAALVGAVREERLPEPRLEEAVTRILEQKLKLDMWNRSLQLIEDVSASPAFDRRLRQFAALKKEGDALAAALRHEENP